MSSRDPEREFMDLVFEFGIVILMISLLCTRWSMALVGRTFTKYWGTKALLLWLCTVGCFLVVNLAIYLVPALQPVAFAVTCLTVCAALISLAGLEWALDRRAAQPAPDLPLVVRFDPDERASTDAAHRS